MSIKLTLNDYYNALSSLHYRTIDEIEKNIFQAKGLEDITQWPTTERNQYLKENVPNFDSSKYISMSKLVREELAHRKYIELSPERLTIYQTQLLENPKLPPPPRKATWRKLARGKEEETPNGIFSLDDLIPA